MAKATLTIDVKGGENFALMLDEALTDEQFLAFDAMLNSSVAKLVEVGVKPDILTVVESTAKMLGITYKVSSRQEIKVTADL